MEEDLVLVVGAGQMGAGIAQVCARAGYRVELVDVDGERVQRGVAGVRRRLARDVEKGRASEEEAGATLARIHGGIDASAGAAAFLAIEAIVEDLEAKLDLWRRLDAVCDRGALLASNTSSISVTRLAAATSRPGRFVGMHFFNPAPVMPLVEVVRGLETEDAAVAQARAVAERLGKTPVEARDHPGFIANRILLPLINEAAFALMEGVAGAEDIDRAARLGLGHPMGPLRLADLIGLDTCLAALEVLHRDLGDPKFRPCPLLRKHVEAGRLGEKAGRGFYEYPRRGG
jgi:3-hydroxybutyryl-CoA dehydrogenase